jgi:quinolinate synthase
MGAHAVKTINYMDSKNFISKSLRQEHLKKISGLRYEDEEKYELQSEIRNLLKKNNASLIAHYYTDPAIQDLALDTDGCVADSLDMAKFMGETAKILSPKKTVLMPTLEATCSLDLGCKAEDLQLLKDQYPDREVIVYANTSAEVKSIADWVVTSSIALDVMERLMSEGKKFIWAPDKHLGNYIQKEIGADMIIWDGSCVVHEEFKLEGIMNLKHLHSDALILAHPECPDKVLNISDFVGSTSQILKFAKKTDNLEFIVATDAGIFHQLTLQNPNKEFFQAPSSGKGATCISCAYCPWMGMNDLLKLRDVLVNKDNEISLEENILDKAQKSVKRMIDFV